jgi:very-short-patch-repair endonuclease
MFKKGYIPTLAQRKKIGEANKKRIHKPDCQCCSCKSKRGEIFGSKAPGYIDGRCSQIHYCINNCGRIVSKKGNKCPSCATKLINLGRKRPDARKRLLGENHWNWQGGKSKRIHYCIDGCGKIVSKTNIRCKSCSKKGSLNPMANKHFILKIKYEIKKIKLKEVRFCKCGCGKTKEVFVKSKWKYFSGHNAKDINNRKNISKNWFNAEKLKKMIADGVFAIKPNKSEKILLKLLEEILPKEYRYVGGYNFWIENFNPDFININGKKKIIELFGYYHTLPNRKEHDLKRLAIYKKHGYNTLIIWISELKNILKITDKIINFNNE